jgi:hypothetical protein
VACRLFAHALAVAQNLRRVTAGSRFEACHPVYVIIPACFAGSGIKYVW